MKKIENTNKTKYPKTHGLSKTRLHVIWHSMYCRCYYPSTNQYKNYGGRGITICEEWKKNFVSFYNWAMNNGYKESLTIDRIDVNGNYEPNNCRWITRKEQSSNTTQNIFYTIDGETKTSKQWCETYNINQTTFKDRLKRGWTLKEALTISTKGLQRKVKTYKIVSQIDKNTNKIINTFNGVGEASRTTGIDARTIYNVCNNKGKTAGGYKWKYESE